MRKTVCKLSLAEIGRFTHHNIRPNCTHHKHCTVLEALSLIEQRDAYSVLEDFSISAITEAPSNNYVWKSRPSAGFNVRQMVRLVQG